MCFMNMHTKTSKNNFWFCCCCCCFNKYMKANVKNSLSTHFCTNQTKTVIATMENQ